MSQDQRFFDVFTLVLGILFVVTLGIYIASRAMSNATQVIYTQGSADFQEQVEDRIRPVGQVTMPGDETSMAATRAAPVTQAEPVVTALTGPQVYNQACLACHGSGIGGAPAFGDAAAWASRIEQGAELMLEHAIKGYQGSAGYMPPKGGRVDLSDQEISDAVDYMVAESQ